MNLAILHFHLNRGGVTSVIANHLRSLDAVIDDGERLRVAILYCGEREGWDDSLAEQLQHIDLTLHVIPELKYDREPNPELQPGLLAGRLDAAMEHCGFSPADTVLHVHNHALGKNVSLPGAIEVLAMSGYPVLLQIHDFAEDGRPTEYQRLRSSLMARDPAELCGQLYPQAENVQYAVLNGRDAGILTRAGIAERRLHRLPNPVADSGELPPHDEARARLGEAFGIHDNERFLLYPVRGIRRKNVGEALLWAALFPGDVAVGLTLPPLNPVESPRYELWKKLAESLDLRCVFDLGTPESGRSFVENLAAADAVLTTSVAEGFGMVFLETWFVGCPLVGRDILDITADFKQTGLIFDHLQPKLHVPIDESFAAEIRERFEAAFRKSMSAYVKNEELLAELPFDDAALIADGCVDFARLDAAHQHQVIERTVNDEGFRNQIIEQNLWMSHAITATADSERETIAANANVVRDQYSLPGCGHRLNAIYRDLIDTSKNDVLDPLEDGGRILGEFIGPDNFYPIRTEA